MLYKVNIDRKSTRLNSSHSSISFSFFFFFNDPAPTEIYPLSLHDALPIFLNNGVNVNQGDSYGNCPLMYAIQSKYRSEEHTSELQSQFHLLFLLFFF